jgi:hypothetical protein
MPDGMLVLRPPVWVVLTSLTPGVFAVLVLATRQLGGGTHSFGPFSAVLVLIAVSSAVRSLLLWRARVTLTAEGLEVIGLRRWQMSWADVQAIEVQRNGMPGVPGVAVRDVVGTRRLLALTGVSFLDERRVVRNRNLLCSWWWNHDPRRPDGPAAPPTDTELRARRNAVDPWE